MQPNVITIVSVNIEGDNHLDRIIPFLEKLTPDVVCLQECFAADLEVLKFHHLPHSTFCSLASVLLPNSVRLSPKGEWGLAILSSHPFSHTSEDYYQKNRTSLPKLDDKNPNTVNRAVQFAILNTQTLKIKIANTHFTWSSAGQITAGQRDDFQKMLAILDNSRPDILCGDFNTPRGKQLYSLLEERYLSAVPDSISSTIDQHLHRIPDIQLVVDGVFVDKKHQIISSKVYDGVSDHTAIVTQIKIF